VLAGQGIFTATARISSLSSHASLGAVKHVLPVAVDAAGRRCPRCQQQCTSAQCSALRGMSPFGMSVPGLQVVPCCYREFAQFSIFDPTLC
jgi:hypothetical protein